MTPELTTEQRAAWRAVLADEVSATAGRRRVPGGWFTTATAAVAAGAVVVTAMIGLSPSLSLAPPGGRAPAMLEAAAEVVIGDPVPGPGEFLRVRVRAEYVGMDADGNGYLSPEVHETFVPAAPGGEVVKRITSFRPTVFYGPGGEALAEREWAGATGDTQVTVVRGERRPVAEPLPRDPRRLLAELRARENKAGIPENEHLFEQLRDILRRDGGSPVVYRALALLPGIRVVADTVVLDGASGTAFGLHNAGRPPTGEVVVDPVSGRYVGDRFVQAGDFGRMPAGTVLELTAITRDVVAEAP